MNGFLVYHDSWDSYYREPFGAVPCGSILKLRIGIGGSGSIDECWLRVWEGNEKEALLSMEPGKGAKGPGDYTMVFEMDYEVPKEPGPIWYYFLIRVGDRFYYYGNNKGGLGGPGELSIDEPASYQITTYIPRKVPNWYKDGVMYQIFVDRFHNGTRDIASLKGRHKGLYHLNWHDTPFYIKDERGRVTHWTFFGGDLEGIRQKLDYLKELGITILYLTPIFEARSNHKYDTGNYMKVDPGFGDEEALRELVQEGQKRGIEIILDGVFSHTGSDSLYFNKNGTYPGLGAFQSKDSDYYSWYRFTDYPHEYESWWGIEVMPNVNEMEPSYREFIYDGEDSVIRYWMRLGIRGWRLDVADELPDEFIEGLQRAVKEENPEGILVGEVWEDATNKVSYGKLREYLWGRGLDSTMNYPLRNIWCDFILGREGAEMTHRRIMNLYENYPREYFYSAMNLIGSHDLPRIMTLLGRAPAEDTLKEDERAEYRLSSDKRELGFRSLKLITLMQMCFPGVPCVYYGDEVGLEGYSDPYNRGTYPWGREDINILSWYRRVIAFRREYEVLRHGGFESFFDGDDIYGFRRWHRGEEIIVLINRNPIKGRQVNLYRVLSRHEGSLKGVQAMELLRGEDQDLEEGLIFLPPLEGGIIHITSLNALC